LRAGSDGGVTGAAAYARDSGALNMRDHAADAQQKHTPHAACAAMLR